MTINNTILPALRILNEYKFHDRYNNIKMAFGMAKHKKGVEFEKNNAFNKKCG